MMRPSLDLEKHQQMYANYTDWKHSRTFHMLILGGGADPIGTGLYHLIRISDANDQGRMSVSL